VYHRNENQYILFLSDSAVQSRVRETRGFCFTFIPDIKVTAWSELRGWNWTAAARSQLGSLYFSRDAQIFRYGDGNDEIYADYVDYVDSFTDDTAFADNTGFTPGTSGIPIEFIWELPWTAFKKRMLTKETKYIQFDTEGTSPFTVEMFTDNFYDDKSDKGEQWTDTTYFDDGFGWARKEPLLVPYLSGEFIGGDALGFGGADFGDSPYGGGRLALEERLYEWPAKFKISKLRFSGRAKEKLKFLSVSIAHITHTVRR
jgi:hypothetical protein